MTEKLTKIRFFIDYEKEERWVNDMSQQGWHLVKLGFGYFIFEKGLPGEYIYRNEMLAGFRKKNDSKEYIEFLKDTGVELVTKYTTWVYFRKKTEEGPFELYSDITSKLQYINRILYLFLLLFLVNFYFGISNVFNVFNHNSNVTYTIGIFNLSVSLIFVFPLFLLFKRRKDLKSKLTIFHD